MLLDLVLGGIAAFVVHALYGVTASVGDVVIGALCALTPDVDFLWHYVRKREVAAHKESPEDHRDGLHYPLVFIPLGAAAVGLLAWDKMWAEIFALATFLHFLHDSWGTGWGLKWLWPFSNKNLKFFADETGALSWSPIVSWNPDELRAAVVKYGDPNWLQNLFVRPLARGEMTPLVFAEIFVPLIAFGFYILWRHGAV